VTLERISSRQNPIVKRFRDAARPGVAGRGILLDGAHLVQEALAAGVRIEAAAFADSALDGELGELARRTAAEGARTVAVSDAVLAAMTPVRTPSGTVAIASIEPSTLATVLRKGPQLIVLLHEVQDPGNVGAVIRAAEACGATGAIATPGTADPFGWKALRGAMGSAFRLPIATRIVFEEARREMKSARVRIVAAAPRGGTPLPAFDFRAPAAILLGGEGSGLTDDLLSIADDRVTIPMQRQVESLNVAVAAGIILYEAARQRSSRR
jgi:TrmH family RNA methyltransferase